MSENKYPWVVPFEGSWHEPAAHGTHKVVPADAIVIERAARAGHDAWASAPIGPGEPHGMEMWRHIMRAALPAAAEYLRANPPVDEAEVERIAKALAADERDSDPDLYLPAARRLYLAGVRAPAEGGTP